MKVSTTGLAVAVSGAVMVLAACTTAEPFASASESASPSAPPAPVERTAAWVVDLGAEVWAAPAVDGTLVYVAATDGVLRAVDARAGTLAWELPTGGDLRAEVLVGPELNYLVSDDGLLYAVDDAGATAWTARLGDPAGPRGDYDNFGSRPALADGTVYAAGQQGVVVALDALTGERVWSAEVDGAVQANLTVADGLVHVGTMGDTHYALDATTGAEVWTLPIGAPVTTHPAVVDGIVLVGSRAARLQARDAATGDKTWTANFGGSWVQSGATPLGGGAVVIGSSDLAQVRAYTVADGTVLWSSRVTGWPWGQPAVADGIVYATELRLDYHQPWDATLSAFDADDGALLWFANTGEALDWAPGGYGAHGAGGGPAVVGDFVVVASLDGSLYAFPR